MMFVQSGLTLRLHETLSSRPPCFPEALRAVQAPQPQACWLSHQRISKGNHFVTDAQGLSEAVLHGRNSGASCPTLYLTLC